MCVLKKTSLFNKIPRDVIKQENDECELLKMGYRYQETNITMQL
jgi:hypothetical protein